jgi:hypothetical protein
MFEDVVTEVINNSEQKPNLTKVVIDKDKKRFVEDLLV